jgi:hypothetical protein
MLNRLPDKLMIRFRYWSVLRRSLNLKKPTRFTEKIQWYKLNYRDELMTQCADKYRMRDYVTEKGYQAYLPKLYQVCNTFDEIEFDQLPNSFAIKSNNGSGTNCFVKDKKTISLDEIRKIVDSWNLIDTLTFGREWAYLNIPQKIIIEELLISNENIDGSLNDYKILCFNKKPEYAWVDTTRYSNHRRNFYDLNWVMLDVVSDCPLTEKAIEKPYGFDKMLEIAECFAEDFPFVRVDFYSIDKKVYIGEITFYPWSGYVQFTPDEFDYKLGELFKMPIYK